MARKRTEQAVMDRIATPTSFADEKVAKVCDAINALVADGFALYVKTKNFHWHVTGPHFASYHALFDDQAAQILNAIDPLAERVRKLGRVTLRSIGEIAKLQSIDDHDAAIPSPQEMIAELLRDNRAMCEALRKAHAICDDAGDVATASILEVEIDATERRIWFLFSTMQPSDVTGH